METIELDGVEIRPADNSLRIDGREVHLEPKVMAVLEILLEHPDTVVSRQTLMDRVWTDRVVGEEVLTRCISELRTALGDDARNPRFIRTIPKKGYRLLQTPAGAPAGRPFAVWRTFAAAGLAAVMLLGLWWVRQNALPVSTEATLRQTNDIGAPDLYLLGRHHWHERTPEGLARAVGYFQDAIKQDPAMAAAYSGLADAYLLQSSYGDRDARSATDLSEGLIERALSLDPQLADAHASRGLLLQKQGDVPGAHAALARAVALDPGHVMAHMWRGNAAMETGDLTAAFESYRTAFTLDPQHPTVAFNYVNTLIELGRYDEARNVLANRLASDQARIRIAAQLALETGNWTEADGLAAAMAEDPVGAELLRWQVAAQRDDLTTAESHLAAAVGQAPDDERVYLAALEHRTLAPDALAFDALLTRWEARTDVPEKVRRMARAWSAIARVRHGQPEAAVTDLAGLIVDFGDAYPPFRLKILSHLLTALEDTGQRAAYERWRTDALGVVQRFADSGWASFEFEVERGYLLAAAGDLDGARASFRAADLIGNLAAARLTNDPRIGERAELIKDFI
ncbi:MAG: winged helix-turn-helix domain-containing protein [Pseudomonadales bacterium]